MRKPPMTNMLEGEVQQNYMRFRISPEMTVAMAVSDSSPLGRGAAPDGGAGCEPAPSSGGDGGV